MFAKILVLSLIKMFVSSIQKINLKKFLMHNTSYFYHPNQKSIKKVTLTPNATTQKSPLLVS